LRRGSHRARSRNQQNTLTNLFFIGDIFGSIGRNLVARHLKDIVAAEHIHLTIANAENSAGGFGITPQLAEDLFGYGLDVRPPAIMSGTSAKFTITSRASRACCVRRTTSRNCPAKGSSW